MKNLTKRIFILILFVSIAMFSIATVTASEVSTTQTYTASDEGIQIEEKYKKVSKNKIIFNANGGKIGSKNTVVKNINKGAKISKFPASPKRTGYNFKGWYSKKSGGTKISVSTKPAKRVTYYAQWTKKSNTNANIDSKLVGNWQDYGNHIFAFDKAGKFKYFYLSSGVPISWTEGKYKTTNGKIFFTEILYEPGQMYEKRYKDTVFEYKFAKDKDGEYLLIPVFMFNDPYTNTYLDINRGTKLRKL